MILCLVFFDLDLSGVSAKLRSCGSEFRRNDRSYVATEQEHRVMPDPRFICLAPLNNNLSRD